MNFKDTLMISFYRFVVAPVALTALIFLLVPFNRKIRRVLGLKFRPGTRFCNHPLWFHSASGEFEYCKPLIRQINQVRPDENIFCSYTSPTYAGRVKATPGVDGYGPLPLDLPGPVSQFLKDLRPKALLVAKTDLWPELIFQCWQKQIPIVVFAVVAKNRGHLFSFVQRWMYNKCEKVLCMTDIDAANLKAMGVTAPIEVTGDPRIDQILGRVEAPEKEFPEGLRSDGLSLLLGSSWPEDEKVILDPVLKAVKTHSLRVIISPHEPSQDHFEKLSRHCNKSGINLEKYSQFKSWQPDTVVYGDTVGVLADLYAVSDLAFIGGSFKSQVHSVGEAIGHGNRVIVGPKNRNNREAQMFKSRTVQNLAVVTEVKDQQAFERCLQEFIQSSSQLKADRSQIQQEFRKHAGSTQKTLQALQLL